jgi:Zn-dependent peptidase ImmA (M78 family)
MSIARAKRQAERLVEQVGISKTQSHVDVEGVARTLGLAVVRMALGDDISGMLVTKGGKTTICIAKDQHSNRQRFTIAHEIGHHRLRHLFAGEHVHVDRVIMRNARSSEGTDLREIEANQFAASLLMPEEMVHHHLHALKSHYVEDVVRQLAKQFKVSEQAMAFRLSDLGYEAT